MVSKLSYLQTDSALAEANGFANQLLRPGSTSSSGSFVRNDHYHWGSSPGWGGWGYYPQPAYCYPSGPSSRSDKDDHSWVAIPAAIIALGTMYFIGQNHAEWSQAKEGMAKLRQKNTIVQTELANSHPALKTSIQQVFEKEMAILDRIRSHAATGLFLKGLLFVSLIVTGIGGLATGGYIAASLTPLFSYGCASTFVTSCAMLYRAGFNSMDTALKADAHELQVAVNQASGVLNEVAQA